jgi:hypothetical protein
MYANGEGVPRDYAEAMRWYRESARQGFVHAQRMLGTMYREGLGVARNDAAAVAWYRRAAEQDEPEAQCELAAMIANGRGVDRDPVEAYMWYQLAARRFNSAERERNDFAAKERDLLAARMTSEQIAAAQQRARAWRPASAVQAAR